jgi:hypothetical protein
MLPEGGSGDIRAEILWRLANPPPACVSAVGVELLAGQWGQVGSVTIFLTEGGQRLYVMAGRVFNVIEVDRMASTDSRRFMTPEGPRIVESMHQQIVGIETDPKTGKVTTLYGGVSFVFEDPTCN